MSKLNLFLIAHHYWNDGLIDFQLNWNGNAVPFMKHYLLQKINTDRHGYVIEYTSYSHLTMSVQ